MATYDDAKAKLSSLIYPGGNDTVIAEALRYATKIVVLTQVEYDALTPDEETIYITTDA